MTVTPTKPYLRWFIFRPSTTGSVMGTLGYTEEQALENVRETYDKIHKRSKKAQADTSPVEFRRDFELEARSNAALLNGPPAPASALNQ